MSEELVEFELGDKGASKRNSSEFQRVLETHEVGALS